MVRWFYENSNHEVAGVSFNGSNLQYSSFQNADLRSSSFQGSNANSSSLGTAFLNQAIFNIQTVLPFSLDEAAELGMIYE